MLISKSPFPDFQLAMEFLNYKTHHPNATMSDFVLGDSICTNAVTITEFEHLSAEKKKNSLVKSIEKLKEIATFSKLKSCQEEIQDLACMPNVSDLGKYYDEYVDPLENCCIKELTLESLQTYLKTIYPKETFLTVKGKFEVSTFSDLTNLHKENKEKPIYILYEFPEDLKYKMLFIFQFKEDKYHLHAISSLGLSSSREFLLKQVSKDFQFIFPGLNYQEFALERHKVQRNCSAIIIDDMRVVNNLINNKEDPFCEQNDNLTYDVKFLNTCRAEINQDSNTKYKIDEKIIYLEEQFLRPVSTNDSSRVNIKATLLSLEILEHYIKNVAEFKPSK